LKLFHLKLIDFATSLKEDLKSSPASLRIFTDRFFNASGDFGACSEFFIGV